MEASRVAQGTEEKVVSLSRRKLKLKADKTKLTSNATIVRSIGATSPSVGKRIVQKKTQKLLICSWRVTSQKIS